MRRILLNHSNNMPALYSVAIIDDNPLIRHYVNSVLLKQKFNILFQAENGDDCISKIQESECLPDLITLDIEMPFRDGFATAEFIRTNWPSIKIIAMSSQDDKGSIHRMLNAGADYFVSKENNMAAKLVELIQTLRSPMLTSQILRPSYT